MIELIAIASLITPAQVDRIVSCDRHLSAGQVTSAKYSKCIKRLELDFDIPISALVSKCRVAKLPAWSMSRKQRKDFRACLIK